MDTFELEVDVKEEMNEAVKAEEVSRMEAFKAVNSSERASCACLGVSSELPDESEKYRARFAGDNMEVVMKPSKTSRSSLICADLEGVAPAIVLVLSKVEICC